MPENTAIVVSDTDALASTDSLFEVPEGCICTIDLTSDEGAILAANAFGSAASLNEFMKGAKTDELVITDIVTKHGVRSQNNNEPCMDTILITADGECLFTQSDGINESANVMLAAFGPDRIHRGVHVKVMSITTRGGNELKRLRVVGFMS